MENSYEHGSRPRIRATFTAFTGAAFTPSSTTLVVRDPDGVDVTYTDAVQASGLGANVLERLLPACVIPGRWRFRFSGDDGTHFAVGSGSFWIQDGLA